MALNTLSIVAVAAGAGSIGGALSVLAFVELQPSSPGVAQVGHINVTGSTIAGRVGAGTAPALARVQALDTGSGQGVRSVTNTGTAVFGSATGTSGFAYGGFFATSSPNGRAVVGEPLSKTGSTIGGLFYNDSTGNGAGVYGRAKGGGPATGDQLAAAGPNGSLYTKGSLPRHQYAPTAAAAMVPLCYGAVNADGTVRVAGTGNWSCEAVSAGSFVIAVAGVDVSATNSVACVTALSGEGVGLAMASPSKGKLAVATYDGTSTLLSRPFMFVVYRTNGVSAGPPTARPYLAPKDDPPGY